VTGWLPLVSKIHNRPFEAKTRSRLSIFGANPNSVYRFRGHKPAPCDSATSFVQVIVPILIRDLEVCFELQIACKWCQSNLA
jgi:hypothetical protein